MIRSIFKFSLFLLILLPNLLIAKESQFKGTWKLEIKKHDNAVVTVAHFKFTNEVARSCIDGEWSKIEFDSVTLTDEKYFPTNHEISYMVNEDRIIIGRNGRCDSYLHLTGHFDGFTAKGKYSAFGLNHNKSLGYFSIERIK